MVRCFARSTRREENVRRVGEVAKLFAEAGVVAVVRGKGRRRVAACPFGFPDSSSPDSWIGYPLHSRYTKPASGDISVIGSDTSVER
ncbi:adenylyl-sulfate kinase [Nocardia gamkensis]|uniref:adenylyl-sulfate kinase n=1 Tax=Nocardia gamkensis TaxID=352869 RepID=UPI0036E2018E